MAANQFGAKSIGEKDWKPHNINIESHPNAVRPTARVPGPDWTSRIRCLPQSNFDDISTSDNQKEDLTQRQSGRRHFPRQSGVTTEEWSFYPDGYKHGKRCILSGGYHGNKQTVKEIQLEDKMGTKAKEKSKRDPSPSPAPVSHKLVIRWSQALRKKLCGEFLGKGSTNSGLYEILMLSSVFDALCDPRGGLPVAAPGDKFYSIPEYSVDFHNEGSTIPAVNFSRTNQPVPDTFIPLCSLPRHVSISYKEKEEERKMSDEIKEVCQLDGWMPAPPLNAAY